MVLSQIAITTATNTRYFVGIGGKCRVKILDFKYIITTPADYVAIMRSSVLNFPNSTHNGLIFTSQDHHQFTTPEALDIPADLAGYIDLEITQLDGTAAAHFGGAVLTLDIIPIIPMPTVKMNY